MNSRGDRVTDAAAKDDGEASAVHTFPVMNISRPQILTVAVIVIAAAIALYLMSHPLICKCGFVKLWHGDAVSAENSQHLTDWYTPSHIIHGFLFYAFLWLVSRKVPMSMGLRLILAVAIEAGWEVFENTDFAINRYREATIALDYYGDSVINSVSDILFMIAGFWMAARLPVLATVAIAIALEFVVGTIIRDNLTLNVIMFLYPFQSILEWQQGR